MPHGAASSQLTIWHARARTVEGQAQLNVTWDGEKPLPEPGGYWASAPDGTRLPTFQIVGTQSGSDGSSWFIFRQLAGPGVQLSTGRVGVVRSGGSHGGSC